MGNDKSKFVIDDTNYIIGKDVFGVKRSFKELHEILMKLVIEFDRVCRKNDIPYALAFGSALGLYNYGGFIPWDDDMDIVVPYEYIYKLVEACKRDLSDEYIFNCYENDIRYNCLIPTGKLQIKNSYLKERNHKTLPNRCDFGHTLYIDICAFMGVPENRKEYNRIIFKTFKKVPRYFILDSVFNVDPLKMKKKIKEYEHLIFERYKDSNYVSQTVIIPWKGVNLNEPTFPKKVIYPFKEYEFNGVKLFSFANVEEFCKLRYGLESLKRLENGVYIDPFNKKKRKSTHIIEFNLYSNEH